MFYSLDDSHVRLLLDLVGLVVGLVAVLLGGGRSTGLVAVRTGVVLTTAAAAPTACRRRQAGGSETASSSSTAGWRKAAGRAWRW